MRSFRLIVPFLAMSIAMLVIGCGKSNSKLADPAIPRKLIDGIYAGSLSPMKVDLDSKFARTVPDFVAAGASEALRGQYGLVSDIRYDGSACAPLGATRTMWWVRTQRDGFGMLVTYDTAGKVIDLCFRSNASKKWTAAMILGADYLKTKKIDI